MHDELLSGRYRIASALSVVLGACLLSGALLKALVAAGDGYQDELLTRFFSASDEYRNTFRNLVAEETRLFETFKESGKTERRREVVADLIVYQSSRTGERTTAEYRDVRSVDGKAIAKRGERAVELLTKASNSGSLEKELDTIDRETERYEFSFHVRGFTINIAGPHRENVGNYTFEEVGREPMAGRDVVVLAFRQTTRDPSLRPPRLPREFGSDPALFSRGRLWLDRETGQAWRVIWEILVQHPTNSESLMVMRQEATYRASEFGIPVPERIMFEWRDHFSHPKGGVPAFGVRERITYTYGAFRTFRVAAEMKVGPSVSLP